MDAARQVAGIRDHYDGITDGWRLILGEDLHWGVFRDPADSLETATSELTERMADFEAPPGARVLDVGCGVGGPALHLARRFGWHVTGISISPVGIAAARAKAAASEVPERLDFRVGNAMEMEFADASFDVAWLLESSHLMPDKARLLSECHRVLEPGGTIALCDLMLDAPLSWRKVHELRDDLQQLEKSFGVARLDAIEDHQTLFSEAGFEEIETIDVGAQVVPTIDAWEANIRREAAALQECFGAERLSNFSESCRILRRLFASEGWSYGIVRARR